MKKSAGALEWPAKILGFTPGVWPISGRVPGIIGSTLAAGLVGKFAVPPILQKLSPAHSLGRSDDEKSHFSNRLGLLSALATAGTLGSLTARNSSVIPPTQKAAMYGVIDHSDIPVEGTVSQIVNDPNLDIVQKTQLLSAVDHASNGEGAGLISAGDLVRGALYAGLGYAAGRTLGSVFGLPQQTKNRLGQLGMIGTLLGATGVIK